MLEKLYNRITTSLSFYNTSVFLSFNMSNVPLRI